MQSVEFYLRRCVEIGGSDVHFKTDSGHVYIRVNGDLQLVEADPFHNREFRSELFKLLKPEQRELYENDLELDFAIEVEGVSRFRGNVYQQRGYTQAAFRVIPYEIQTMEDLRLPGAAYDFIERPRGLVLMTGPAGSGKSTSLAAMIDKINRTHQVHIVTVEDPIEFVHSDIQALVNQRELGNDTNSFANALKYVLRQDPDVILVGEMRDLETIHLAITAAETGHLVFGTLHTVDAVQTVDRIVDVFPTHQQQQVRMQLSVNLVGVISQTLLRRSDGRGRVAAFETLVATGAVRNLIRENKTFQISSLIQTGGRAKMQSLDQNMAKLVEMGIVTYEEAKSRAKDPAEFERLVNLATPAGPSTTPANKDSQQVKAPPAPPGVRGAQFRPGYQSK
ncbi:MAG: type IV pilus twitching motility protein PilT [Armatimonadetes bacterium]|nr:type IV pilus twitching motility protein PilT [Armatimonadota bacterium]